MPNLNKFIGCGHLAETPQVKVTAGGTHWCEFRVGISSSEKVNGEWKKVTEWVTAKVFGKQAEWLGDAQKGDLVIFEGKLKTRSWEKDGFKQYKTEVICESAQAVIKKVAKPDHSHNYAAQSPDEFSDEVPFMRLFDNQF